MNNNNIERESKNRKILYKLMHDEYQNSYSASKRWQIVQKIADEGSEDMLVDLLIQKCIIDKQLPSNLDGIIFEILRNTKKKNIISKLDNYFQDGLIQLSSSLSINYQPLQSLLMIHSFQEADKWTQSCLCQLVGLNGSSKRNWLYFTDVSMLPAEDLYVIDMLWRLYSRGKFGFSIQREIWLSNDYDWEKLWEQIGWKDKGLPRRYPNDFVWSIEAPEGHLPLFNQLRGVQVLSALFTHSMWNF